MTEAPGRVATRSLLRAFSILCGAARLNYGSTVIVLLPPGVAELAPELQAEVAVKLGQRLAVRAL